MSRGLLGYPRKQLQSGLLGFPLGGLDKPREAMSATYGVTNGTGALITAGAANTKGSWVELCPAAGFDADGFFVSVSEWSAHAAILMDIGFGPSGSEVAVVQNMLKTGGSGLTGSDEVFFIPIPVPARERVSVRIQSTDASLTLRSNLRLVRGNSVFRTRHGKSTTLGSDTSASLGTAVAFANAAKGAWTQLGSVVPCPASYAICSLASHESFGGARNVSWDLGVGPPGAETVIVSDMASHGNPTTDVYAPNVWPLPVSLHGGECLVARGLMSNNTVTAYCSVVLFH